MVGLYQGALGTVFSFEFDLDSPALSNADMFPEKRRSTNYA
jgi:hypothetical protein